MKAALPEKNPKNPTTSNCVGKNIYFTLRSVVALYWADLLGSMLAKRKITIQILPANFKDIFFNLLWQISGLFVSKSPTRDADVKL